MIFLVAALRAEAAMVRVVAVVDGRTIAIERNGVREQVKLAGVEVTNEAAARELLRWTAMDAWVMLETSGNGEFLAYRSPDALFLNRELVLRGYARPTSAAIAPDLRPPSRYLGEINPPDGPKSSTPKVSAKARPRTSSGTGRRPPKARPRGSRSRAKE
jgi:hypothetical protein